jgi:hypothetical protein
MMNSLRKKSGDKIDRKRPITPAILKKMRVFLDLTKPRDIAFWTAALIAFWGMMRSGNVVPRSSDQFQKGRHIALDDLSFVREGVMVTLSITKTIRYRERKHFVPLPKIGSNALCPVSAIKALIKINNPSPKRSLFTYKRGNSWITLTYKDFVKRTRLIIEKFDKQAKQYAGHSYRRGGATFASYCGVSEEHIKNIGDWRSDAVKIYIVPTISERFAAPGIMAQTIRNGYSRSGWAEDRLEFINEL